MTMLCLCIIKRVWRKWDQSQLHEFRILFIQCFQIFIFLTLNFRMSFPEFTYVCFLGYLIIIVANLPGTSHSLIIRLKPVLVCYSIIFVSTFCLRLNGFKGISLPGCALCLPVLAEIRIMALVQVLLSWSPMWTHSIFCLSSYRRIASTAPAIKQTLS